MNKVIPTIFIILSGIGLYWIVKQDARNETIHLNDFILIMLLLLAIIFGILMYQDKKEKVSELMFLSLAISTIFYALSPLICNNKLEWNSVFFLAIVTGTGIYQLGLYYSLSFEKILKVLVWFVGAFAVISKFENLLGQSLMMKGTLLYKFNKSFKCLPKDFSTYLLTECAVILAIIKFYITEKNDEK